MSLLPLVLGACQLPTQIGGTPTPNVLDSVPELANYRFFVGDAQTGALYESGGATVHVGRGLREIAASPSGDMLFMTDPGAEMLHAYSVSGTTPTAVQDVPVGTLPSRLAVAPDGRHVYVSDSGGNSVSIVNTASWVREATIEVPPQPEGIAFSPDGTTAYVACLGGAQIVVLNTVTAKREPDIWLPGYARPSDVAVSTDGSHLYVTESVTGKVFVVDVATSRVVGEVSVGLRPTRLVRTPDGTRLYVANVASQSISVVDISDAIAPRLVKSLTLPGAPEGLALSPDGKYLVAGSPSSSTVSVIDTFSETILTTRPIGIQPSGVALLPR